MKLIFNSSPPRMPIRNHGNTRTGGYNPSEGARQPEHIHGECTNTHKLSSSIPHSQHTHARTLSHTPNQGGMNIQTQSFFGRSSFVMRRDKGNSQLTALWSEKVPRLYCPDVTSYQTAPWSLATRYSPPQSPFRCVGSFFVHLGNANEILESCPDEWGHGGSFT